MTSSDAKKMVCGPGQYNGHGESSVSIGKAFKLCQEKAMTGNSSSPPQKWFSRERSRSRGCPISTACRAAASEGGRRNMRLTARAFPGSGNPVANKDHEMLELEKENEGLRKEVAILKNSGPF